MADVVINLPNVTGSSTASSSAAGVINVLPETKYNATPPTLTDGQFIVLQGDSAGNLKGAEAYADQFADNTNAVAATMVRPLNSATYCATLYSNLAGSVTKANVKATAGNAFSLVVTNRNAAVRYLGLHNKATAPAAGEAPLVFFMIPATSTLTIGREWFSAAGVRFSTGIGWAIGTTVATFTDSATASEHEILLQYI